MIKPCPICGTPFDDFKGTSTCSFDCGVIFRTQNYQKNKDKKEPRKPKPTESLFNDTTSVRVAFLNTMLLRTDRTKKWESK